MGRTAVGASDVSGVTRDELIQGLQEIIKQEQDHQIELASALGIIPDPRGRSEKSPFAK